MKNELDLAGHKTSIRLRDIAAIDSISSSIVNESSSKEVADFTKHWCRQRRARRDWQAMILPCKNKMPWNSSRDIEKNATDPDASFISLWDIRPAGQYSRFSIQSQTKEGHPKLEGGDSWRVVIRGPSFISPTVIDHGNGTYEVLFLAMEAGVYKASVILDFTSCNGFKDPPVDWFIIGESNITIGLLIRRNKPCSINALRKKKLETIKCACVAYLRKGLSGIKYFTTT